MRTNKNTSELIKEVEQVIKNKKEISITDLFRCLSINRNFLDQILETLVKQGKIIIAKYQGFVGNKVVNHSVEIKWIGGKDDKKSK